MKKRLIIGFIAVILFISILPFPQNIERTYYGINTQNGEVVDIALDMKCLKFLFFKNKMHVTITVKTETETFVYGDDLDYRGQTFIHQEKDTVHDFSGWYNNHTMYMKEHENGTTSKMPVGSEPLLVHLSSDFDKILILHNTKGVIESQEDRRYIGCVKQNQLEDTIKYFSGFYD